MPELLKTCYRCKVAKPENEWHPSRWKSGEGQWCRDCYRQWHRDRYSPQNGADDSPRDCVWCGESYRPKQRRSSRFCSRKCGEAERKASGRTRRSYLERKYGITLEDYDEMMKGQGGTCALCKRPPHEQKRYGTYLHVDHDHATGQVRGLLCGDCNLTLGRIGDDVDAVQAVLNYLTKASST